MTDNTAHDILIFGQGVAIGMWIAACIVAWLNRHR